MEKYYQGLVLDEERALYGLKGARVENCRFEGPADGESALKECRNIEVKDCDFSLRYPFWHVTDAQVENCRLADTCRAALWYDENILLKDCRMMGIKALRECKNVHIRGGEAQSAEFGWLCRGVRAEDFSLKSEYPFFSCSELDFYHFYLNGKYSFQYVKNAVIRNSVLNTKDAFWHAENVTVADSVIKGEYLAWYSKNLHLVRCTIIGTQPLCYCEGLKLENCTMIDTDLAFENSQVEAAVRGHILSVKNPVSGFIRAGSIGEIILDENLRPGADCRITVEE